MLTSSPYASSSRASATCFIAPASSRPPSTTSTGSRSSSTSLSSRGTGDPDAPSTLAESLLREDIVDAASPATSEGAGGPMVCSPSTSGAMDVCHDDDRRPGHTKLSRRISTASSPTESTDSSRRPADGSRPPKRKTPRLDDGTTSSIEITSCPPAELLSLLASLLQHIARSNDARRVARQTPLTCYCEMEAAAVGDEYPACEQDLGRPHDGDWTTASKVAHSSSLSTLCFHARNVPSIAIEAYLLRILKYCPTTNEVFIALLVYFDRMARSVPAQPPPSPTLPMPLDPAHAPQGFAIDSFNVHRLLIAGVTVASKMLSDVFYTNSRYAKVGGLPLAELNQLELQFLLLNDFCLTIPLEELQAYADHLLLRWRPPPPPELQHRHSDSEASSSAETARPGSAAGASDEGSMVA